MVIAMRTILVIEDDENLRRGIAFALEKDGFEVITAGSAEEARGVSAGLIILDIGLPDQDGFSFCREIRERSAVPVIMLTARDMELDEVRGLDSGADDYITKPFSLAVLRARVTSLLRRAHGDDNRIHSGNCVLEEGRFYIKGNEVPVSATEFRLLRFLMKNPGRVLSKEQILSALWDSEGRFVDDNALSVNISRLRSKIEADPKKPQFIKTIHGFGYVWGEN